MQTSLPLIPFRYSLLLPLSWLGLRPCLTSTPTSYPTHALLPAPCYNIATNLSLNLDAEAKLSFHPLLQATPMPNEYSNVRVPILCNDCSQRSTAPFHVLGHKCPGCGSYNTRRT